MPMIPLIVQVTVQRLTDQYTMVRLCGKVMVTECQKPYIILNKQKKGKICMMNKRNGLEVGTRIQSNLGREEEEVAVERRRIRNKRKKKVDAVD